MKATSDITLEIDTGPSSLGVSAEDIDAAVAAEREGRNLRALRVVPLIIGVFNALWLVFDRVLLPEHFVELAWLRGIESFFCFGIAFVAVRRSGYGKSSLLLALWFFSLFLSIDPMLPLSGKYFIAYCAGLSLVVSGTGFVPNWSLKRVVVVNGLGIAWLGVMMLARTSAVTLENQLAGWFVLITNFGAVVASTLARERGLRGDVENQLRTSRYAAELRAKNEALVAAQQAAARIFNALAESLEGKTIESDKGLRYVLEKQVGEGGFAAVYAAMRDDGVRVAIKIFRPVSGNETNNSLLRFRREAELVGRIQHPAIVSVLDSGLTADGLVFIVMEFLSGATLRQELENRGRLPIKFATKIAIATLDALAAAHREGLVHRDIKPDNIFVSVNGAEDVSVKLIDFGVAMLVGEEQAQQRLTMTGMLIGTPAYMAPEQCSGAPCDGRTDVYGLGVVLFEAIAGHSPFGSSQSIVTALLDRLTSKAPRLSTLLPTLPGALDQALAAALESDINVRPSAETLSSMLQVALPMLPEA